MFTLVNAVTEEMSQLIITCNIISIYYSILSSFSFDCIQLEVLYQKNNIYSHKFKETFVQLTVRMTMKRAFPMR